MNDHPDTRTPGHRTGEPWLATAASWAVLVASFGLSASTWIALAQLAGFTGQVSILGLFAAHLTWLMPVAIDGYVVSALVLWMAPVPAHVAAFARKNTYAAAGVGVAAQSAFHCLLIYAATRSAWQAVLAAVVGALPPGVAALAVHMRALVRRKVARRDLAVATGGQVSVVIAPDTSAPVQVEVSADADRTPAIAAEADTQPAGDRTPEPDTAGQDVADTQRTPDNVTTLATRAKRAPAAADTSIDALADTLTAKFKNEYVGGPKALVELKRVYGSCSKKRAIAAKDIHNARREHQTPTAESQSADDEEREAVVSA